MDYMGEGYLKKKKKKQESQMEKKNIWSLGDKGVGKRGKLGDWN